MTDCCLKLGHILKTQNKRRAKKMIVVVILGLASAVCTLVAAVCWLIVRADMRRGKDR